MNFGLLKQQQLEFGLSTWTMCDNIEAWVKVLPGVFQVELLWGWSRFCLKKSPLKSVALFLWNLFSFWQNQTTETSSKSHCWKEWCLFYCSISKVVHFDLFCSYYIVFASHYFLAVCKHQHIQTLRDLMWKTGLFVPSLSPFLVELDVCVHILQLCHERIYDTVLIFLLPLPHHLCAAIK